jgi:hypothetical protein
VLPTKEVDLPVNARIGRQVAEGDDEESGHAADRLGQDS